MNAVKLNQPVQIIAPYNEVVLKFLHAYFDDEIRKLRDHFGIELKESDWPNADDDYLRLRIAESLEPIARVAAGDTRGLDRSKIYGHVQGLLEKLFSVPGEGSIEIPNAFWQSPFGSMVMIAYVWCQGDRLITITEASDLSGKSIKSISQFVVRGKLRSYPDMSEPNPRRRMRVLKSEIKALR